MTTEDQLAYDLAAHFTDNLPTGIPAENVPIVYFRRQAELPEVAIIIGHEGSARVPSMIGTAHVKLRVAIRTSLDDTTPEVHSAYALAMEKAILALSVKPGDLALTYLHQIRREAPSAKIEDRRQLTVLNYNVTATRYEEAP